METLLFAESRSFAKKNLWWSIFRSSRLVYGIENNRRSLLYSWSGTWWKFPLQVYGEEGVFYCCGIDQKVIKKAGNLNLDPAFLFLSSEIKKILYKEQRIVSYPLLQSYKVKSEELTSLQQTYMEKGTFPISIYKSL